MQGSTATRLLALSWIAASSACLKPAAGTSRPSGAGGAQVSLRYEGSCAYLACCSAYAVSVAAQTPGAFACDGRPVRGCNDNRGWFAPGFTCDPRTTGRYRQPQDPPFLACSDEELWLSIPDLGHAQCGVNYVVCARGVRVIAVARDRSYYNDSGNYHYEASLGVLRAIGGDESQRDTIVSVYPATDGARIAADPACVAR